MLRGGRAGQTSYLASQDQSISQGFVRKGSSTGQPSELFILLGPGVCGTVQYLTYVSWYASSLGEWVQF